jgi:hypothetical protein
MVLPCILVDQMVLICILFDLRVPPCTSVDLMVTPCTTVELTVPPCIMVGSMVPPCILVGPMDLPYNVFEGDIVFESWGSQIDWENFLVEEFPPNYVGPIKDLNSQIWLSRIQASSSGNGRTYMSSLPSGLLLFPPHRSLPHS